METRSSEPLESRRSPLFDFLSQVPSNLASKQPCGLLISDDFVFSRCYSHDAKISHQVRAIVFGYLSSAEDNRCCTQETVGAVGDARLLAAVSARRDRARPSFSNPLRNCDELRASLRLQEVSASRLLRSSVRSLFVRSLVDICGDIHLLLLFSH